MYIYIYIHIIHIHMHIYIYIYIFCQTLLVLQLWFTCRSPGLAIFVAARNISVQRRVGRGAKRWQVREGKQFGTGHPHNLEAKIHIGSGASNLEASVSRNRVP